MGSRCRAVLGLAAVAALGGCETDGDIGIEPVQVTRPVFAAKYVATEALTDADRLQAPYPNDIYFAGSEDGTLNLPLSPLTTQGALIPQVNRLDGYPLTANVSIPMTTETDLTSIVPFLPDPTTGLPSIPNPNLFVTFVNADFPGGFAAIPLVPGITDAIADYTVRVSPSVDASGQPSNILEIVPLKPFLPDTTYAIYLLSSITDVNGSALSADVEFATIRDAHFAGEAVENAILEGLRAAAIGPLLDQSALLGIPGEAIAMAFSMSTMSLRNSLEVIDETQGPSTAVLAPSGFTTADVIPGVPGVADIFVGTLDVPYYLDPADPYGSTWQGAGGTDLNRFNPVPVPRTTLTIPVLATAPNAFSGQTKPDTGWPVLVYLSGVNSDRSSMLALSDSFAAAGYFVIGIDLPLQGIIDPANPLFQGPGNPLNPFGDNERHFFLDLFSNTTFVPGADGITDTGGQVFTISLTDPLTARDYVRQTTADFTTLIRTLPTIDLDADGEPDLDTSRIHHTSVSLGAIESATLLAVNDEITTSTLSSPGGNFTLFLTDDDSFFGRGLVAGLAASGIIEGTVSFDYYVRDWQHGLDAVDALNGAIAAAALHPLHVIEILNDNTVPDNSTDRFAEVAGLLDVSMTAVDAAGVRGIVRMTDGGHVSYLDPNSLITDLDTGEVIQGPNPLVTVELQTQAVTFAVTNGTTLPVDPDTGTGCDCVQ
ncbi:MAG: hypothetical protein AAF184_02485 [Pseudomonadota bacterium]